jgi:hypothetical protein
MSEKEPLQYDKKPPLLGIYSISVGIAFRSNRYSENNQAQIHSASFFNDTLRLNKSSNSLLSPSSRPVSQIANKGMKLTNMIAACIMFRLQWDRILEKKLLVVLWTSNITPESGGDI